MSYVDQNDQDEVIDYRDADLINGEPDPVLQDVIACTINAYRRAHKLQPGGPVPALNLVDLASGEINQAQRRGQPLILFFGSYN